MCGRFTLRTPLAAVIEQFAVEDPSDRQQLLFEPRYNIAPTQAVLAIRAAGDRREAVMLRWGLVPPWARSPTAGPPQINARAETLATKPTFRNAFRRQRCLIPADGFYEWQQREKGTKQPYYIHRPDNGLFAFAGLWEHWGRGPTVDSCTIITAEADPRLRPLHDRMPVILHPDNYQHWLDPALDDPAALAGLLLSSDATQLVTQPVSTYVNRVVNDGPQCVEPVETDRTLF